MSVPRFELAPGYQISRLIKGGWQLAGGHGAVDVDAAVADMTAFADAGITTFDCADIYTGVEALIGSFLHRLRAERGAAAAARVQVHTKCVPDRSRLPRLTRDDIRTLVDRSLQRLGVDTLDLVQLHWWDYGVPGVVLAAQWLDECRRQGKIRHIGLTNFDSAHVSVIVASGVPLVSHQVQYSVLDRRPSHGMAALCGAHGVGLLTYGALAGGFLSERWLGQPEPGDPLENRSLVKYQPDHPGVRRVATIPGAACGTGPHRPPARHDHRRHRRPMDARPARRGRRHRRGTSRASSVTDRGGRAGDPRCQRSRGDCPRAGGGAWPHG